MARKRIVKSVTKPVEDYSGDGESNEIGDLSVEVPPVTPDKSLSPEVTEAEVTNTEPKTKAIRMIWSTNVSIELTNGKVILSSGQVLPIDGTQITKEDAEKCLSMTRHVKGCCGAIPITVNMFEAI